MEKIELSECLKRAIDGQSRKTNISIDWTLVDEMELNPVPTEYRPLRVIEFNDWTGYMMRNDFIASPMTVKNKWRAAIASGAITESRAKLGILNLARIKVAVKEFRQYAFNQSAYDRLNAITHTSHTQTHTYTHTDGEASE